MDDGTEFDKHKLAIQAPDTITVKMDGKYWRVIDVQMGSRRLNVSRVVEREKKFWEMVA